MVALLARVIKEESSITASNRAVFVNLKLCIFVPLPKLSKKVWREVVNHSFLELIHRTG